MSHILFPDDYVNSIYDVDFNALYNDGYRAILFDVDNTLVPHGAPADARAVSFFHELKSIGFKTLMISNNREPRVKSFCETVGGDGYLFLANKPSPKCYKEAMNILQTSPDTTLFAGDQIFTDIWGARRANIRSIMVKPILKWHEPLQIVLKRLLEALVIIPYKFNGPYKKVPLKRQEN